MLQDVKVPEISENVKTGHVVEVLVKVGDTVAVDDVLIEMETDKAVVEIPSPYAGKIGEVLVGPGDEKNVGDVIVRIEVEEGDEEELKAAAPREASGKKSVETEGGGETETGTEPDPRKGETGEKTEESRKAERSEGDEGNAADSPSESSRTAEKREVAASESTAKKDSDQKSVEINSKEEPRRKAPPEEESSGKSSLRPAPAAPSIRRFARELGVDIHEVTGGGIDGRISQADVSAYVRQRMSEKAPSFRKVHDTPPVQTSQPPLPDFSRWGKVRMEKLETVRRLTAENTSTAWRIVPQVTQFDEADITDLSLFIDQHGKSAEERGGKLTITAILMKVCAEGLVRFPRFNASIDLENERMIYKEDVHIGIAVDTPRGLLVPVIRSVQNKGIIDLAVEVSDTARRARDKKVKPEEFEGGTFTISNQGGIGGVGFTPVVLWPQAAILGISRARRSLVESDGEFIPRRILPLSVSYDHRIADGADAARFLGWVCRSLAQAMMMFL